MEEHAENFYNLLEKIGNSNSFKTPLGSHKNYIEHIVLRNCQDYMITAGIINDNLTPLGENKREEFRHYFNSIVSMEQILDYLYFETKDNYKIKSGQRNFKKNILNQHPILKEISETANAFKHCITNNPDKKNAKDAVTSTIKTNISLSKGLQDIAQEYHYDSQLLIEGFKFWLEYINGKKEITLTEGA